MPGRHTSHYLGTVGWSRLYPVLKAFSRRPVLSDYLLPDKLLWDKLLWGNPRHDNLLL